VQLRVNQEVKGTSHFDISVGNGQPNFETALTTQDGQTVVTKSIRIVERIINEEKIPWLGDLPRVGYLFHKHIQHVEHSELFVILTPHVVSSREKPAGSRRNSRNAEQ
jgi:type II secretory pathway component HofQ